MLSLHWPEVTLTWEPVEEEDFDYYAIYRGIVPDFEIGEETWIGWAVQPTFADTPGEPVPPDYTFYYRVTAFDFGGNESEPSAPGATSVRMIDDQVPTRFALHQSQPNPLGSGTMISFDLPIETNVALKVFDVAGRRVVTLVNDHLVAGCYRVPWTGMDESGEALVSGIYFYRLEAGEFSETRKLLITE
ncbi:T9SS type A sorting domain-containing protein [Candidatus Eisenbacteria bacterium]|uniref:T9SS type A sorting domain-containing protein n=1 Tax=Eiseniibacteriota bacterium TaxID=2212470 RepID=A0ABV6YKN2_UNCEI